MSRRMHSVTRLTGLLVAALALSARADATTGSSAGTAAGITVSGTGEAKAKPTSVELAATVSADAELTADAVVKFNDTRKKALAALDGLKLAGLSVEPGGMSVAAAVDASAMQRMNGAAPTAQKTRVTETLKLVLTGLDKLSPQQTTDAVMRLIDTGRDAGLMVGPKTPSSYYEIQMMNNGGGSMAIAQFRIDDAGVVRDRAYALAVNDAKLRAGKLAALTGVTLGPVLAVREGADNAASQAETMYAAVRGWPGGGKETATSPNLGDIAVKVNVTVQFAISEK